MKKFLPLSFFLLAISLFAQENPQSNYGAFEMNFDVNNLASQETVVTDKITFKAVSTPSKREPVIYEEFSSEILQQRLLNLRNTTPFQVEYNATVERFIRLYLKERKDEIANLMDKAKYYFPIFEEHLDKYNLPLELKYLAVVESALRPNARSITGAKGLWQFMYHTGKEYGLQVTSYIDERMDPIKSTEAACKYLQYLYDTFGDWDLALAAYNSGSGNVSKAIRRSGGLRNYWNIRKYLPSETRGYLPAFYATLYLFEYSEEHQIHPKNIRITYFDIDTIHIKKSLTFTEIQNKIAIDDQLLAQLNPQYKQKVIPKKVNGTHVLTLPKNLIPDFIQTRNKTTIKKQNYQREVPLYITPNIGNSYTVKSGDNLTSIAREFGISIKDIKQWNGLETNYVIEGQRLVIINDTSTPNSPQEVNPSEISNRSYKTYRVREGDSLFLISKKFPDVTISQLRSWNNIWNVSYLKPGTELKILTSE